MMLLQKKRLKLVLIELYNKKSDFIEDCQKIRCNKMVKIKLSISSLDKILS